jgi:transposase
MYEQPVAFFNTEQILQLPLWSPFPGLLSVLIMDNARIHHGEEILDLCDRFGMLYSNP